MIQHTDEAPTPAQQAAWDRYVQARKDAGKPVVQQVKATDLRPGDVLAGGGTLTSDPSRHPSGVVVVEIDYVCIRTWEISQHIDIYERDGGRR